MEEAAVRTIVIKYVGGPKDGESSRCEVGDALPVYSMVLATQGQPYLIRRKLTAAIYRFEGWSQASSGPPTAELKYLRTEDHRTAHETIQSHANDTVPVPD